MNDLIDKQIPVTNDESELSVLLMALNNLCRSFPSLNFLWFNYCMFMVEKVQFITKDVFPICSVNFIAEKCDKSYSSTIPC